LAEDQVLLQEAVRIGNELLDQAKTDEHGIYWESMTMASDETRAISFVKSEGIYSGNAGILLFLAELYKQTQDQRYYKAVEEGTKCLAHTLKTDDSDYYALVTGRFGVLLSLIDLAEFLNHPPYVDLALEYAHNVDTFLGQPGTIMDFINGVSGTLTGLLMMHEKTGQDFLLDKIELLTNAVIKDARPGAVGLYWDRSNQHIRGLCGFSHGVSGIGYAFLQVGQYVQNPEFYKLAQLAFAYENHYYDGNRQNWPDFRNGIYDEPSMVEYKGYYNEGKREEVFAKANAMSAWCHGAPGVGLSRIKAIELLDDQEYKDDLEKALDATRRACDAVMENELSYTLCHGGGGNAMLFTESYKRFGNKEQLDYARKVATQSLTVKQQGNSYKSGFSASGDVEDISMFMGNAGIGYFLLQTMQPEKVPSMLLMGVEGNTTLPKDPERFKTLTGNFDQFMESIMEPYYAKSLPYIRQQLPQLDQLGFTFNKNMELRQATHELLQKHMDTLEATPKAMGLDLIAFEKAKWMADKEIWSDSFLYVSLLVEHENNMDLVQNSTLDDLMGRTFVWDEVVRMVFTKYRWVTDDPNQVGAPYEDEDGDGFPVLIQAGMINALEYELNDFSAMILDSFKEPAKIQNVYNELKEVFEIESPDEEATLKQAFESQIKQAMQSGILIEKRS